MFRILPLIFYFVLLPGFSGIKAQQSASPDSIQPKYSFGIQFLGQALFTAHAEFWYLHSNRFSMNIDAGFGRAEYADDIDLSQKATRVVHLIPGFYYGNRWKLVCAVHPSWYFQRHYSFIDINGFFGVRYFPRKDGESYFMLAYTPRLFYAPTIPDYIFTNVAVAFRAGFWF